MTVNEKLEVVLKIICLELFVDEEQVRLYNRGDREVVKARHAFCLLSRKLVLNGGRKWNNDLEKYQPTVVGLKTVGAFINRDHTSVLHSVRALNDLMDTEPELKAEVARIELAVLSAIGV